MLDGRVAIVTGGGRGIGRGISLLLASQGATLAVNYRRDEAAATDTVDSIIAAGGVARAFAASVDDSAECAALATAVTDVFGGIDILICNAGVASRGRPVADTDAEELQRLMASHAMGPHQMCRAALPSMRARAARRDGRGDIVFISSVVTRDLNPNSAPYNMGKAAMEALSATLAKEERRNGIHVNVVAPGIVETDMGVRLARAITGRRELEDLSVFENVSPFGHVARPIDVASVVLWLCSPGAGYVTGQRIECDGGGPLTR